MKMMSAAAAVAEIHDKIPLLLRKERRVSGVASFSCAPKMTAAQVISHPHKKDN